MLAATAAPRSGVEGKAEGIYIYIYTTDLALEKGLRLKVPRSVKLKFIGQNVSLRVARIMSIGSKRQRGPQLGAKTISEQQREVAPYGRVKGKYTQGATRIYI